VIVRKSRIFFAGAVGACLLSGATLAAANAAMSDAEATIPARTIESPILPAPEAQLAPESVEQPASPAIFPAPAAPARRPIAASGAVDSELTCLARVVLYEAGAESRAGQLAVAQVVMNRTRSGRFPRTICGVINQRGQFSSIRSFRAPTGARWNRALGVAREARAGGRAPGIGNALFFHAAHVRPFAGRTRVARLGGHIFYR
jgi:spore germination cell wall hydrolase CwlJ-like protein